MATVTLPSVVLFGDSLTQYSFSGEGGWGAQLSDVLQRKCDVICRGFSGYNTAWCKLVLPKIITNQNADDIVCCTIFLGANDSSDVKLNPRQNVPLVDYEENLIKMVQYLQSVGIGKEKLILIGPPPVDVTKWGKECGMKGKPQAHCNEVRGTYAEACRNAAKRAGVDHVELYSTMMEREDWTAYLNDGLHFTAEGAKFVFNKLLPLVEKKTAHLDMIFPLWDAVDYENPQNSFT